MNDDVKNDSVEAAETEAPEVNHVNNMVSWLVDGDNIAALDSFKNAHACDPESAFGGVIACNYKIKKDVALELTKNLIGPSFKFSSLIFSFDEKFAIAFF